ncbi:helix-turn-helix domain-containing protein [Nioella aestuarii]|uniref:helix-turn-helix domain-containing protein n=1 Tax=Nioella aestuarii TaxID=1662864 RepID=UPI003D7FA0A8
MLSIPISWLISILALIAAAMLVQASALPKQARAGFLGFLSALAMVGLLIGLRLQFGWSGAARVQPFVAILLGPTAYLGFRALVQDDEGLLVLRRHAAAMLVAMAFMLLPVPYAPDVIILVYACTYLFLLTRFLRYDSDRFAHVPDPSMLLVRAALIAVVMLLGLVILADGLITIAALTMGDARVAQVLSGASGALAAFIFLALLVAIPLVLNSTRPIVAEQTDTPPATEEDRALVSRLDSMLTESGLYRDSNLTLARIARRLGQPARDVSGAVNRVTGQNVSRHINGFRVRHAQHLLETGDLPVTEVMLDCGFISKSSFNAEFRRITGATPTAYRASTRG